MSSFMRRIERSQIHLGLIYYGPGNYSFGRKHRRKKPFNGRGANLGVDNPKDPALIARVCREQNLPKPAPKKRTAKKLRYGLTGPNKQPGSTVTKAERIKAHRSKMFMKMGRTYPHLIHPVEAPKVHTRQRETDRRAASPAMRYCRLYVEPVVAPAVEKPKRVRKPRVKAS